MSKIKPGLGRGLDALINPQNKIINSDAKPDYDKLPKDNGKDVDVLLKIPVEKIIPNHFQPRHNFDQQALDELKKSILENGLIQPITVRRKNNVYELISGERRLRACKDIGYREIPAYIIKVDSEEIMLALALIENIQRENLNPIEVGLAYKRLMDECLLTQDQIAEKVGKDRSTIANSIRLLKLPQKIQNSLIEGEITAGHARALINLPNPSLQLKALEKIINDNLSVRKVEKLVKILLQSENGKPKYHQKKSGAGSANQFDVEDKLRKILGTKVKFRQKKDGSGQIIIEYYSTDEFERLFELFQAIDKNYS